MNVADAAKIKTYEEEMKWPHALAIGAIGVSLVEAQMIDHKIIPCRPTIDIGFDLVSVFGSVLKRVQVKATQAENRTKNDSTVFNVTRTRAGMTRNGKYMHTSPQSYREHAIDIFVFVHIERGHYYVVPASALNLSRHKISLSPTSEWSDAWHLLKTE